MKTQIFVKVKYDLKGHSRSDTAHLARLFYQIYLSIDFDKKKYKYIHFENVFNKK